MILLLRTLFVGGLTLVLFTAILAFGSRQVVSELWDVTFLHRYHWVPTSVLEQMDEPFDPESHSGIDLPPNAKILIGLGDLCRDYVMISLLPGFLVTLSSLFGLRTVLRRRQAGESEKSSTEVTTSAVLKVLIPRFGLRTLTGVVAVFAVMLYAYSHAWPEWQEREAVSELSRALHDYGIDELDEFEECIRTVRRFDGGACAIPMLVQVLRKEDDEDDTVRMQALYVLTKIGPSVEQAVPALVELTRDENKLLADTAKLVLVKIDPDRLAETEHR